MKRREFIRFVGAAAAWPLNAGAQQPNRMLRVGAVTSNPRSASFWRAFDRRMTELGYIEGKNYTFEFISAAGPEAYEAGYKQIAARGVDVMLSSGPEISLKSAVASSSTIPIVMVAIGFDPIGQGYVAGLARPSGNITGLFLQQIELTAKRLQLLKSEFTDLKAVTVFRDRNTADQWEAAQRAGAALGLRVIGVELRGPPFDYEKALAQTAAEDRGALLVLTTPPFFRDRQAQADFALTNRLVSMFAFREWVEVGGLMSYGPSISDMFRRAADYVDRIARGAKPGDLPIEQPTKFELLINLKTAKALGLTLPTTLLARADEVIE